MLATAGVAGEPAVAGAQARPGATTSLEGNLSIFDWCAFSACGGPGGTLAYKQLIAPYLKMHPKVHITLEAPPASGADWVVWENTVLSSGTAPALIAPAINMQPWLNTRWYENLNSLMSAPDPYVPGNQHMSSLFNPVALQEWNDNGTYYSLAFTSQDAGMVYNKAVFKKAGITSVPTTWAELLADCAKITKIGDIPIGMDVGDTTYGDPVPAMMAAFESNTMQPVFDKITGSQTAMITPKELLKAINDGTFGVKSPGYSEAWALLKDMSQYFEPGAAAYTAGAGHEAVTLFTRGTMGMVYTGSYSFPTLTSDHIDYGIFALPQLTSATWKGASSQYQGTGVMSYWDSWPWAIAANSVSDGTSGLAQNLLQWLAVPQHQNTMSSDEGQIPVASTGNTITPSSSQSAPLLSIVDYIVQHPSRITTAETAILGPSGETDQVKIMQEYLDGQLNLSGAMSQMGSLLRQSAQSANAWIQG
jgi:raffinose/stachyose/melibiose transport system substrate-binding protein